LDFTKFDIIYAGAQKNMGPAGTTLIVKEEILENQELSQVYLDYEKTLRQRACIILHLFPVYASLLTLQWLKTLVATAVEKLNNAKRYCITKLIETHYLKLLRLKIARQ
jgi:phosphoserine aminotransferase